MKQSSIEWLFDQLVNRTDKSFFLEELNQAKEMHKQEIIEAREDGYDSTYAEYCETPQCYLDGSSEQYYNERFKSE